jgi:hypothetical protein
VERVRRRTQRATSIAAPMRAATRRATLVRQPKRPKGNRNMLRLLGFRPNPVVALLIAAALVTAGIVTGRAMLIAVGVLAAVFGLAGAFNGERGRR